MKCPFCNEETIQIPDMAMWLCKNDECITPPKEEFYVSDYIAIEWQARAEKAESELKAIKDRIEAVTDDEILEIIEEQDEKYMNCLTADEYIAKAVIEKIKQIGGVK